jgi:hypothetical protein
MNHTGAIEKMRVQHAAPVAYSLPVGEELAVMNPLLGKKIALKWTGEINCIHCGRLTKKSFQQGYCYPCTQRLARCDMCILKPELCHYHKGTCREPEWGRENCMIDHFVYLAVSSGLKVGITRHTQIPTRWIDQGAVAAVPIARVASRYDSGRVEVALAAHVKDKTNWRDMLRYDAGGVDLIAEKNRIRPELQALIRQYPEAEMIEDVVYRFEYPVIEYPKKIKPLTFDKTPLVEGTLIGIKGQYLMFDIGVINIRKHSGYKISMEC